MTQTIPVIDPAESDALLHVVRQQITLETFDTTDRDMLKRMVECLGDTRGVVRLGFAESLGEIGEPATPFLIEALAHHSNVVVRRAAAKTLTIIADPTSIPPLVQALLHDDDTVVKGSSVGALARMGEAAVPVLLDILASPDLPESTKGHAAWALAFIGAEAKELLYRHIDSESVDIRYAIVGAIAKVAQEQPQEDKAFQVLLAALEDESEIVRSEAASALGNLSYPPAIPPLVDLLHHASWESRKSAALALMKIGMGVHTTADRHQALEPLEAALPEETEAAVQTVLKLAISQIANRMQQPEDEWD